MPRQRGRRARAEEVALAAAQTRRESENGTALRQSAAKPLSGSESGDTQPARYQAKRDPQAKSGRQTYRRNKRSVAKHEESQATAVPYERDGQPGKQHGQGQQPGAAAQ